MDNHFNPAVSNQCIARAHRYGQDKPVHCYRLAIEGTLETKVYKRSANKSGVASGVVDGEYISQSYKKEELDDLKRIDCWATCSVCDKRRLLPSGALICVLYRMLLPLLLLILTFAFALTDQDPPDEYERWCCDKNKDQAHNSCNAPEQKILSEAFVVKSEDPILEHIHKVVNKRTRKSAIVRGCVPVASSSGRSGQSNKRPRG